jgi:hypothetical protein
MEKSRSLSITPCTRAGVLTICGFAMSKFPLAVLGQLLYMPESIESRVTNSPYPPIRSIAMRTTQCIGNVKVLAYLISGRIKPTSSLRWCLAFVPVRTES